MPRTKLQNFVFTLMTAALMAYFMIVYSVATNSPSGFVNETFLIALKEFPLEGIIVFLLAFFVASPIAKKSAFKVVNPKEDNQMIIILTIQSFTVLIMVTLMSLYALIAQHLVNVTISYYFYSFNSSQAIGSLFCNCFLNINLNSALISGPMKNI